MLHLARGIATVAIAVLLIDPSVSAATAQGRTTAQRADTTVRIAGRAMHPGGGMVVTELTVGVVSGPAEYMFGGVGDVLETHDGSVLVLDSRAPAIRKYDAKGTYVRTIGARGQGPGEYLRPIELAELRDGRVLLIDDGNVRVNVYGSDGESIATWSLRSEGGDIDPRGIIVDTTGTAIATVIRWVIDNGVPQTWELMLRFAPSGAIIDTIHAPRFSYEPPSVSVRSGRETVSAGIPFFPRSMWAWSPLGYLVTGVSTRYAFELRVPRSGKPTGTDAIPAMRYRGPTAQWAPGDGIVSIRHSAPAVRVSDEQRSRERANVETAMRRLNPTWMYSGPDVPRVKPPYTGLRIGEDGTIWVQLSMPGERYIPDPSTRRGGRGASGPPPSGPPRPQWREPVVYDVFEPDGRLLGRVAVPANVSLIRLGRARLWGSVRDEDGVQVVKRFRMEWR